MDEPYQAWIVDLANSIFKNGQEQQVGFRFDVARQPHLVFGRSRRLATIYINDHPEGFPIPQNMMDKFGGWPLRGRLVQTTEAGALDYAIGENADRRPYGPIDFMNAALHCVGVLQMDQKETAIRLKMISKKGKPQQSTVSILLSLAGLPHKILSLINSGRLTLAHGRKLVGKSKGELEGFVEAFENGAKLSDLLRQMDNRSREGGKRVSRSLPEIREALGGHESARATALLNWLNGVPSCSLEAILLDDAFDFRATRSVDSDDSEAAA